MGYKKSVLPFSTSLTDSTGNLGTWKIYNSPSLVNSDYSYGKSAYFPDYNSWIESNFNVSQLMRSNSFSISCYFKITHTGSGAIFHLGGDIEFMDYRITNQKSRFYCAKDGNGRSWVIAGDTYWDSGRGRGMGTYTIPLNQWNRFELKWNQYESVKIYINDILDLNIAIPDHTLPNLNLPIKVGAGCSESGQGIYLNDFKIVIGDKLNIMYTNVKVNESD